MVMVSGIVTSRAIFSFGSSRWPVMRCTRRRNDATERSRSSSAESAVTTVRRPRRFSPPLRGAFGAAAARAARRFIFVGLKRQPSAGFRRRHARLGAKSLLRDLVGFALGFFLVLAALFFLALARFRSGALGADRKS